MPLPNNPTTTIGQKCLDFSLEKCFKATGSRTKPAKNSLKLPNANGEYRASPFESKRTLFIKINELPQIKARAERDRIFLNSEDTIIL